MEPVSKLNSYINSAIPYAWDDSESWFEFLGKVLAKVNEIIEKTNDYFDVDIKQFVVDRLNEWRTDGTLESLLNIVFEDYDERITEVNTTVDNLTTQLDHITKQKIYLNDSMSMVEMQSEIDRLDGVGGVVELVFSKNYIFTTTLLLPNNTYVKGNDSRIVVNGDYPIFKNKNTPTCSYIELHDFQIHDAASITSRATYHILLENPTLSKVDNIRIYSNEMTKSDVGGIHFTRRGQSAFVNKISNCVLNQASIVMEPTDSWITNNAIWAYSRSFGINVSGPSQFINKNQIVGSSIHGGIYLKDTVNGYNLELLKITDNYLDGSYAEIDSGIGIKGQYVTQSVIANNDFWRQMDEGILLSNSNTLKIVNNTFKDCNRRDSSKDDIHLNDITYSNIAGNTHTRTVAHENKGKPLYDNGNYNIVTGNIVFFTTNYNASEVSATNIKNNNLLPGIANNVNYTTQMLFFYKDMLASETNNVMFATTLAPRYISSSSGSIVKLALSFTDAAKTGGNLSLYIYIGGYVLNNGNPVLVHTTPGQNGYIVTTAFEYGLYPFSSGDAIAVKYTTDDDFAPAQNVAVTLTVTLDN